MRIARIGRPGGTMVRLLAASVLAFAAAPSAATDAASDDQQDWHFHVTPYLWLASLEGDVATLSGAPSVAVDASFSDILDNTDLALMLFGEVRYKRFGFFADINYLGLSTEEDTPGMLFGEAKIDSDTFFTTMAAFYRILEADRGVLDVSAGLRLWHVDTELKFTPGILAGRRARDDETWVDPVAGARGSVELFGPLFLSAGADIGAGASEITWQAVGTLDLRLGDHFTLRGGYRHIGVDYDHSGFVFDVDMSGPILGLAVRF